jgi:malonyl CoA-acyl carrier protein transacylase/phosphopantetheinyl transferase (holo-ACP synthase)
MLRFREELRIGEAGRALVLAHEDRTHRWDAEMFVVRAADRVGLLRRTQSLQDFLRRRPDVDLKDLAYTLNTESNQDEKCLAVVAASSADLHARLTKAAERLTDPARTQIKDAAGIYYFDRPLHDEGTLAFLFPGEGAQYLNMLTDLRPHFPEIEQSLEDAERLVQRTSPSAWHAFRRVFRFPSDATEEQRAESEKALRQLDTAMFSVMLADWAIFQLLSRLGLKPAAVAGHSMGEVSALQAAGCIDQREGILAHVSAVLNVLLSREAAGEIAPAVLLAVGAGRNIVEQVIRDSVRVGAFLAMDNCPHQTVVVGPPAVMVAIEAELQKRRLICERLPFERPYHTPLFEPYLGPLRDLFNKIEFRPAQTPVYSCSTGLPFASQPDEIRRQAVWHYAMPVEFTRLIRNMHADGVRVFVECGPRGNLTAFAEDVLRGERFAAVASNVPHRSGITQLNHLAAQLAAHRVPFSFIHLYSRREPQRLKWDDAGEASAIGGEMRRRTEATLEQNEPAAHGENGLGKYDALPTTEARPDTDAPTDAYTSGDCSPSVAPAPADRSEIVMQYFAVMEQFLGDQSETINAYLARVRHVQEPKSDFDTPREEGPLLSYLPMLRTATVVRFEAGKEIVVHRKLDLREDLFASHHTVGGQAISKVDPDQHGLPVMPMTFSLELMAELASTLVPNQTVVGLKSIRLFRWLAFNEVEPTSIELSARLMSEPALEAGARFQVQVQVRELAGPGNDAGSRSPAAQGIVLLAECYAEPPPAGDFPLTNEHPSPIPLDVMYKNLFHGPLFQGAQPGGRSGNEGIESSVVVLPRNQLLASNPDPDFLMDPVLLDVSMHPITGWHLEFPDQSGRILLPVELEKFELFGPRPEVGNRFTTRGSTLASSYRNFVHAVDLVDQDGKLWSRMHRLTFWRFYVPFANVNFHGPKDEYFISKEWDVAGPRSTVASCIRLDVPPDQKQAGMRTVTAKVILAPQELDQFRTVAGDEQRESQWLFDRLAGKDAVRLLWHARHGERLFPADIIIEMMENGRPFARRRGPSGPELFPTVSIARTGDVVAALAAFGPYAGIALKNLRGGASGLVEGVFHKDERKLLDQFGPDRDEWMTRLWCAKQAIGKALNCGLTNEGGAIEAYDADPETGRVKMKLGSSLGEFFPELRSGALVAHTARDGDLVVATSFCERAST